MVDERAIVERYGAVRRGLNERGRRLFAAAEARTAGHSGNKLLGALHYRRQVNRKTLEGSRNPDRDAQFEHINAAVLANQAAGQPVISIDTKKKELIGPYKNVGSDYRPQGCPDTVRVHDFVDDDLGKVVPYGVYDIAANAGCVSVGIDNDTAQFAVNSIRRWLDVMGRERYPTADRLMITADGRWLERFAGATVQDRTAKAGRRDWPRASGLSFSARHVEVEQDRAPPVLPYHADLARQAADQPPRVVELIAATTTKAGLRVCCELAPRAYPKGIKVSDAEMHTLNITGDAFHPEWNYTIMPRQPP